MSVDATSGAVAGNGTDRVWPIRFLLFVAGLGGLLYGIDVGIIATALPYLQATSGLNASQLSMVAAAVLAGGVLSTLFAGMLADWMGRKNLMMLSGMLFVASIPMIALSQGYGSIILGRLLQGISAGLIGVVVPLYLAESLSAASRGKGTGVFQWLLTLGIFAAAAIGPYFSARVAAVEDLGIAADVFAVKDFAWRTIFWVSMPPGVLFVLGALFVPESPRWLFRRGRRDDALSALLRSRVPAQAAVELKEMEETASAERAKTSAAGQKIKESLLHRKYVIPFLLACIILTCNQLTGVNSLIAYNTVILIQAGLTDGQAHWGYTAFTLVNFLVTIIGVVLVDRKGRKFLLSVGTAGIIVSMIVIAVIFHQTEKRQIDCTAGVQKMIADCQRVQFDFNQDIVKDVASANKKTSITLDGDAVRDLAAVDDDKPETAAKGTKETEKAKKLVVGFDANNVATKTIKDQKLVIEYSQEVADKLLSDKGEAGKALTGVPTSMILLYSYGDFHAATKVVRSDDKDVKAKKLEIMRDCVPGNRLAAPHPFINLDEARAAPLKIDGALITPVPSEWNGWLTAVCLCFCMAFFAVGPGVCVWLALSELMPTRIRSNGMSIALLLNIMASTVIAAIFLPTVAKYGYAAMFLAFAAFTVIYFITATFLLPETKGKTLEEIEEHFSGHKKA
jgi:MFS family permease